MRWVSNVCSFFDSSNVQRSRWWMSTLFLRLDLICPLTIVLWTPLSSPSPNPSPPPSIPPPILPFLPSHSPLSSLSFLLLLFSLHFEVFLLDRKLLLQFRLVCSLDAVRGVSRNNGGMVCQWIPFEFLLISSGRRFDVVAEAWGWKCNAGMMMLPDVCCRVWFWTSTLRLLFGWWKSRIATVRVS